jgi:hypothetical protein
MQAKRKLQLAGALVSANGLLALMAITSSPAFASTCTVTQKVQCGACYSLAQCQAIAAPGCTAVSNQCLPANLCHPTPPVTAVCNYM